MEVWHLTPDAPRRPRRASAGEVIELDIGTWPVQAGQTVTVHFRFEDSNGAISNDQVEAVWQRNEGQTASGGHRRPFRGWFEAHVHD